MKSNISRDELSRLLEESGVDYTSDGLDTILYYLKKLNEVFDKYTESEVTALSISIPTVPVDGTPKYRMEYKYVATLVWEAQRQNLPLNEENVIALTQNNAYLGAYFSM